MRQMLWKNHLNLGQSFGLVAWEFQPGICLECQPMAEGELLVVCVTSVNAVSAINKHALDGPKIEGMSGHLAGGTLLFEW